MTSFLRLSWWSSSKWEGKGLRGKQRRERYIQYSQLPEIWAHNSLNVGHRGHDTWALGRSSIKIKVIVQLRHDKVAPKFQAIWPRIQAKQWLHLTNKASFFVTWISFSPVDYRDNMITFTKKYFDILFSKKLMQLYSFYIKCISIGQRLKLWIQWKRIEKN